NPELFGIDRRHRLKHPRGWAPPVCDSRRNDAAVDLSRHLCRPGQHDAHHLAGVHADRAAPRYRSHLVWRSLPDLHAARPPAAAARTSADDDEGRRAQGSHDGPHFRAVVPYVAMSLVLLIIIIMVPAIATWLPNV